MTRLLKLAEPPGYEITFETLMCGNVCCNIKTNYTKCIVWCKQRTAHKQMGKCKNVWQKMAMLLRQIERAWNPQIHSYALQHTPAARSDYKI